MLRFFALVGLLLLSPSLLAAGQPGYISDKVYLYLHGGPGTQFRILGSIEAGQSISLSGETQGDYTKIIDHKGREGWVESKMVTRQKSFRELLPEVQAELEKTKSELEQALNTSDNSTQQLSKLKSDLDRAQRDLAKASSERDNATSKLANIEKNERFQMWQEGGIIAAIGLLVGVILVYLPRPRRKKKNHW
ncbi:TIGR04211 family SH3 domain-containing protein [Shewanella eurypsychrophilus]|uniref:TIGR04211 family SH3 domain-containing protein n=1 Tax=Shewanella eurypsychrophilus TaxID=2593656 RepID=A0ABX6VA94_9GAMM|nr:MULTISPECIES: TIGR04211 family SH3 domain-containing protein [Shewanella]QFU24380.1 TIGR04211 family SH3 domain-containing protein [Shewanella sp. YLB-09]QPG59580.1 TIGR04211 family SH3 domain-containing protein [Shewanella eurypsychrophilus]